MNRFLLSIFLLAGVVLYRSTAHACSPPRSPRDLVDAYDGGGDFPINGVLFDWTVPAGSTVPSWVDAAGTPVAFIADDALGRLVGRTVLRPQGLRVNTEYRELVGGVVSKTFRAVDADSAAPSIASIGSIEEVGSSDDDGGGGCLSAKCGGGRELIIEVGGTDSAAPLTDLFALTFVANTAEEAAALQTPTSSYHLRHGARIWESVGFHDGGPVSFGDLEGRCTSIALMDRAGNVGPRSEPQCFAPSPEGGGCRTGGRSTLWALLPLVLGFFQRRSRRQTRSA